ncbi:MAG: hypothetical protein AB4372_12280 [Xenococcus sp. (in: cyanobacteria)]
MNEKRNFFVGSPSPLWVISLFVSLTEVVTGIAVIQATGGIQIALTAFVILFPLLIATIFFLILWFKPYVFYPPKEFGKNINVTQFVEAMQRRQEQSAKSQRIVITSISDAIKDAFSSPEIIEKLSNNNNHDRIESLLEKASEIAERDAKEALSKKFINIDTKPILGNQGEVITVPYDPLQDIGNFLDDIWFYIYDAGYRIPPYRYGEIWALKDAETGQIFLDLGRNSKSKSLDEYRSLAEVGFKPGMLLIAILKR